MGHKYVIGLLALFLLACDKFETKDDSEPQEIANIDSLYMVQLSDEFNDGASLVKWKLFDKDLGWPNRLIKRDINQISSATLYMRPMTSTWYGDYYGPFVYKPVARNFTVIARVRTRGLHSDSSLSSYSLGGIMVRKPRNVSLTTWTTGGENWLFVSNGFGNHPPAPNFEIKTTVNSVSTLTLFPADTGWVELRIIRQDADFQLSRRYAGQDWFQFATFRREDMNVDTLDVGVECYTDWSAVSLTNPSDFNLQANTGGSPDLQMWVDYIRFSRP